MDYIYEEIIEIVVAIAIIFIFPLIYFGQKQDALIKTISTKVSQEFVDDVRSKGYITKDMYHDYLSKLSDTGMLYEIDLEHRRHLYEPEYRFRTPNEVVEEQDHAYTGPNHYTYHPVSSSPPIVDDPINDGNLNTETNESVLESSVATPASPSHIHMDDCYQGHRHTDGEGISESIYEHGCYVYRTTSTSYCYGILSYIGTSSYIYTCSNCRKNTLNQYQANYICEICGGLTAVSAGEQCGDCGAGTGFHPPTYVMVCSRESTAIKYKCLLNEDKMLDCSLMVASINPTHPIQTVAIGDPLITTVTATYKDGSTKVVLATANTNTNTIVQNKTVTLTYSYVLDGISYSKQCTITITVIARNKTCQKGHSYNLKTDGTDPGCPYCRAYLSSLKISSPASGSITIYQGTSLLDNGITLLASYMDGRTEYVTSGYVHNLDSNYIGTQTVTIGYKGWYVNLIVTTKRNLTLCSVCDRYYELYPDGSDPGCPYCISLTPIYTGKVLEYYDENYSDIILKELYEGSGIYYLSDGDHIQLQLYDLKRNWGGNITSLIYKNLGNNNLRVICGGYVRENGGH